METRLQLIAFGLRMTPEGIFGMKFGRGAVRPNGEKVFLQRDREVLPGDPREGNRKMEGFILFFGEAGGSLVGSVPAFGRWCGWRRGVVSNVYKMHDILDRVRVGCGFSVLVLGLVSVDLDLDWTAYFAGWLGQSNFEEAILEGC